MTGAFGYIGTAVCSYLKEAGHEVIYPRDFLDISDYEKIRSDILNANPSLVLKCMKNKGEAK